MLLLASPTTAQRNPHSLDATRTSRKAAKSSRSFALRLQRVDGRRFDALVADILCSRLHGVAAVAQADMSFSQYQSAVGRVISILADGRANVIVKAV